MKKAAIRTAVWAAVLILAAVLAGTAGGEEKKKLTLMIYMCGSNLESRFGSASEDILEMRESQVNSEQVNVLVMTGGATQWDMGYDPEKTLIHHISRNRVRTVWPETEDEAERLSMADPKSLAFLLDYGTENYPAEDYALILWDHGGGPMNGLCWDELYNMEHMSLTDLVNALQKAKNVNSYSKLSWIGFDACLMGSLEVACSVAPYAEYMIASQEMEPPHGWDYVFLAGLEEDVNGKETGKRIIDLYLESAGQTNDPLTLSCIDLGKIPVLIREMDLFFSEQAEQVSEERFPELSGIRMHTSGFGKANFDDDAASLDLVDLGDLTRQLGVGENTALTEAMAGTVVCSRTNRESAAAGLSAYHPYQNKKKYKESWQQSYRGLKSSQGYADYIFRFGALLTAGEMTDWSGLIARNDGSDEAGVNYLSCALTPEQAKAFVSGRLRILEPSVFNNGIRDSYNPIGSYPAELGEDGVLRASYSGRGLYVVNPDAEEEDEKLIGPLGYILSDDGKNGYLPVLFQPKDTAHLDGMQRAFIAFEMSEEGKEAPILRMLLKDDATGMYTSRMSFREEDYSVIWMESQHITTPETNDHGTYSAFKDWPEASGLVEWTGFHLGTEWHMEWQDSMRTEKQLAAVFEVTDMQQNSFCSSITTIENPALHEIRVMQPAQENEMLTIEMSGQVCDAETWQGVRLKWTITNRTDKPMEVRINNVVLNGTRAAGYMGSIDLEAYQTGYEDGTLELEDILFMQEIETVEAEVQVTPEGNREKRQTFYYTFRTENADLTGILSDGGVLAETEQDGILWQLVDIGTEDGDLMLLIRTVNRTEEKLNASYSIGINGLQTEEYGKSFELSPKQELMTRVRIDNSTTLTWFDGIWFGNIVDVFRNLVVSDQTLARHGITEIREITLNRQSYETSAGETVTLTLKEPWPIPGFTPQDQNYYWYGALPDGKPEETTFTTLIDWPEFAIRAERVIAGDNGLALLLDLENRTDLSLEMSLKGIKVSGKAVQAEYDGRTQFIVMPHGTLNALLSLKAEEMAANSESVTGLSFIVSGVPQVMEPTVKVTFAEPLEFGRAGGMTLEADSIQAKAPEAPPTGGDPCIETEKDYVYTEAVWIDSDPEKDGWNDIRDWGYKVVLHENRMASFWNGDFETKGNLWVAYQNGTVVIIKGNGVSQIYQDGDEVYLTDAYGTYRLEPAE